MKKQFTTKILCVVLVFCTLFSLFSYAYAYSNESDQIIDQIKKIYEKCKADNDNSAFKGYCGRYVNFQIIELGIGTSWSDSNGGNGKDQFGFWSKKATSPGGYDIKAYSSSDYSLKEALTAISIAYPDGAYNILVSYKNGDYGHVNFIHAILDGNVYFSESFAQWVGSTHYQEGEPIVCSISKFSEQYEKALGYPFIGAIHFLGKENACNHSVGYKTIQKPDGSYAAICKDCGAEYPITVDSSSEGIFKVKQDIILCSAPYQDAQNGPKAWKNSEYTIIGSTINAYGSLWYKTIDGYWIYKDYVTYVSSIPKQTDNSLVSVAEGTYYIEAYCGKVVDVKDKSKDDKASIQIWENAGNDNQEFIITKSGNYYTLSAVHSGKVIDVADGSAKSGTNIWQYSANGSDAQKWQFEDAGGGYYYIRSALGTYMDVESNGTANGANIWAYEFNGSNAQKFRLVGTTDPKSEPEQPRINILTVKYNTNGGTITSDTYSASASGAILMYGNEVGRLWAYGAGSLESPTRFGLTREGYSFVGWSLSKDGNTTVYEPNVELQSETICPELKYSDATVTLYAIWEKETDWITELIKSITVSIDGSTVTVRWRSYPGAISYTASLVDGRVKYESESLASSINEYTFSDVRNGSYFARITVKGDDINMVCDNGITYRVSVDPSPAPTTKPDSTSISVTVNGKAVAWTDAEPFIDENSRTMVPLRAVAEALGLVVEWDGNNRIALFSKGSKIIYFPIDSMVAYTIEGGTVTMDTAAVIVNDRTFAPIRYLAEYFGYTVGWDGATRTVLIT